MNFYGKLRPERKSGAVLRATRHSAQPKSRGGDDEDNACLRCVIQTASAARAFSLTLQPLSTGPPGINRLSVPFETSIIRSFRAWITCNSISGGRDPAGYALLPFQPRCGAVQLEHADRGPEAITSRPLLRQAIARQTQHCRADHSDPQQHPWRETQGPPPGLSGGSPAASPRLRSRWTLSPFAGGRRGENASIRKRAFRKSLCESTVDPRLARRLGAQRATA